MIQVPIQVKKADFFTSTTEEHWLEDDIISSRYFMLRTEIIGDFTALNYLIFSEEDAELLYQLVLSPEQQYSEEMKRSLLMEIDNIVSASVIVKLSDQYHLKIHGDVPTLEILDVQKIKHYLKTDLRNFHYSLTLNSYFEAQEIQFKPQFIWYFDRVFLNLLNPVNPDFNLT